MKDVPYIQDEEKKAWMTTCKEQERFIVYALSLFRLSAKKTSTYLGRCLGLGSSVEVGMVGKTIDKIRGNTHGPCKPTEGNNRPISAKAAAQSGLIRGPIRQRS